MTVATASSGAEVRIEIRCDGGSAVAPCGLAGSDPRLESASRRVVGMGGRLATSGDTTVIHLPCYHAPADSTA
jgi:hypothetical protein